MRFLALRAIVAVALLYGPVLGSFADAQTPGKWRLAGNQGWIVLASRENRDEAIAIARYFSSQHDGVRVFKSSNDRFAIVLGPSSAASVDAFRKTLPDWKKIPADSFRADGRSWVEEVWRPAPNPIKATVEFDGKKPAVLKYGKIEVRVTAKPVEGKGALPQFTVIVDGAEVLTVVANYDAFRDEPHATVHVVRLDRSTKHEQVILEAHTGGAHCCMTTRIAYEDSDGKWRVIDTETLDGSGYGFEDVDGDGVSELLSVDNSFLYAFDAYAYSNPPIQIHSFQRGELKNVTKSPVFQARLRQVVHLMEYAVDSDIPWNSNGFLGGWVAAKALIGQIADAWGVMLAHYDRNSQWDLSTCAVPVTPTGCPDDKFVKRTFPEALRAHLEKNGYGPVPNITVATPRKENPQVLYQRASAQFAALPFSRKSELQMLLAASGYWNAVSFDQFNMQLFEAIKRFQNDRRLPETGWLSEDGMLALRQDANPVLDLWRLRPIFHPSVRAKLWVPGGLDLNSERNEFGYRLTSRRLPVAIFFTFYSGLSPAQVLELNKKFRKGVTHYEILRHNFFVAVSEHEGVKRYIRYQAVPSGAVGFTLVYNANNNIFGDNLSTIMSDLFRQNVELNIDSSPPVPQLVYAQPAPQSPSEAKKTSPQPAPPKSGTSSGSAFAISTEGHYVTNWHVVEGCKSISLKVGERIGTATIIAQDATNDLAVMRSDLKAELAANLRTGIRQGENVVAFGFPLRGLLSTTGNITTGLVSATTGLRDDSRFLQITAQVQVGNSGGPLLDQRGNVVGVVTGKLDALRVALRLDDLPQNVNFAVKVDTLNTFLSARNIAFSAKLNEKDLPTADIADMARKFSAYVECRR